VLGRHAADPLVGFDGHSQLSAIGNQPSVKTTAVSIKARDAAAHNLLTAES
jgi:hypothetical protein